MGGAGNNRTFRDFSAGPLPWDGALLAHVDKIVVAAADETLKNPQEEIEENFRRPDTRVGTIRVDVDDARAVGTSAVRTVRFHAPQTLDVARLRHRPKCGNHLKWTRFSELMREFDNVLFAVADFLRRGRRRRGDDGEGDGKKSEDSHGALLYCVLFLGVKPKNKKIFQFPPTLPL